MHVRRPPLKLKFNQKVGLQNPPKRSLRAKTQLRTFLWDTLYINTILSNLKAMLEAETTIEEILAEEKVPELQFGGKVPVLKFTGEVARVA